MKFISRLLVLIPLLLATTSYASDRPNVILILTDDQGYGDVSLHGNPVLKTPNLDHLARGSVQFTDFHVAPMCSPTRGQLMTGVDAMRNGCTAVCQGRSMIRSELPTMANYFAGSGYATGHFGKWHLGDSYPHRPQDRGFQETLHHRAWGITSLADHWDNRKNAYFDPILEHNGTDKQYEGYCTDIFFGEAMKWIEKQSSEDKPFFCYLPTNTPHVPDISAEKYWKPYDGKFDGKRMPSKFYGMIANLDENLGKLETFLKEKGLRDSTLLIYMSDNGTQSTQAKEIFNFGMREKKTSVYEGGHRVPLFVRWPEGRLAHGSAVEELTQVQDLLPTLIELCGLKKIDSPLPFNGMSLAGLLKGDSTELPDRKLVVQYRESGESWDPAVVMWNQWRLLKPKKGRNPQPPNAPLELYHVGRDPGQKQNVAADHPDVLVAMKQHYEEWHAEAKRLFDRPRWISVGTEAANPMILYSQDWVGDYCDNPGGLSSATAHGYWNVDVDREGVYEIELRRWPKESNKTLTEGWADGPGGVQRSARPITAANLKIANKNYTLDTRPNDRQASFRIRLSAGRTQLATLFLDAEDRSLCSAIYVYLRRLSDAEADDAKLTPQSNRKPAGRAPVSNGPNKDGKRPIKKVAAAATPKKPNIVLMFIDDMGYGDIGPFGNKVNSTPNLDRMAKEGNVLRQFYVSNTACTPSRSALMTGTYAHRIGMDGSVVFPGEKRGLNPKEVTIAEILKQRGYATGCFGKWHLGDQKVFLPLAQGFDEYFGIPYSNDMWPGNKRGNPVTNRGPYEPLPVIRGNEAIAYVSDGADQSLLCEVVTDEAIRFIKDHKDEPFFCYVPHAYIHNPRFARPEIMERAEGDTRRANIEEVDGSVGRILTTLRDLKLAENTLVMFTSDNGGAEIGPLRGKKGGPKYEGHMREPTLTWWPGTIPAGVSTEAIATTTDLLPSFAKLTGAKVPTDRTIDGKDVLNVLLGKPQAMSPHDILYYETTGIRRGDWKLVQVTVKGRGLVSELYNLKDDLGERNNLAARHPDIVADLEKLLQSHAERIAADTRPAAFVENAKPILTEPGELPRLRDFMGRPDTKTAEASAPNAQPKPAAEPEADGGAVVTTKAPHPSKPNFVVILADDQGWNALSTRMDPKHPGSGSTYYQTPNLDRLAAQGMRFSQAYSPAPTCSPTRHAIQFGRSPASLKIFGADRITDWDATSDESLANVLKRIHAGYVCAHLGKWHVGRTPDDLGFDVSDGMTGNGVGNSADPEDPKLIFDLSRRSNQFIDEQVAAGKPFFLQISHYANHLKFQAKAETIRKYETQRAEHATPYQNRPLWAAMNENLDAGIGMVLDRIEALGIADNTYVIYTADNGYELKKDNGKPVAERQFYQAYPQRSHKYTVSEGGIRVPFVVRGPGIPTESHSSTPVVGTDIFATVMDLAGGSKHLPKRVEGASLSAHLKSGGKDAIERKDSFLVFKYSKPNGRHDVAIVQGDYKLIKDIDADERYLFNLAKDIGERKNLADDEPERVKSLYGSMTSYLARFGWDEAQAKAEGRPKNQSKRKAGRQSASLPTATRPVSAVSPLSSYLDERLGAWSLGASNSPEKEVVHNGDSGRWKTITVSMPQERLRDAELLLNYESGADTIFHMIEIERRETDPNNRN